MFGGAVEFTGFSPVRDDIEKNIASHCRFIERPKAENDPSLKQIIPYSVVVRNGLLLLLRRFSAQSESRLHDKYSIGVGGHINPSDSGDDVIKGGFERELHEELAIEGSYEVKTIGYVNDEKDDVGSVHFGVVGVVDAAHAKVVVRETDMMEGKFVAFEEARSRMDAMEGWSRILMAAPEVAEAVEGEKG